MTPDEIQGKLTNGIIRKLQLGIGSEESLLEPLFQTQCNDGKHSIIVEVYAFGQYRIRITDTTKPDSTAPEGHGSIVRELDSYKIDVAADCISELIASDDCLACAETFARPWNTAFTGDRIRLDNPESEFRPS